MTTAEIVNQLVANGVARASLLKASIRLNGQIHSHKKSIKDWYDVEDELRIELFTKQVMPYLQKAATDVMKPKDFFERRISELAKQLPVWSGWAEGIRGIGPLGLGLIIGQTGNLGPEGNYCWDREKKEYVIRVYTNPAKVWKRMGIGVDAHGKAQRRVRGPGGILQGFSPTRRALAHVMGDALIKQNRTIDGHDEAYRTVYVTRKVYELERITEPIIRQVIDRNGRARMADITQGVCHKRAMRYMEKRFLRDLWRAWQACCPMTPSQGLFAMLTEVP